MIRPGFLYTATAVLLGAATCLAARFSATESVVFVSQLLGFVMIVFVGSLIVGSALMMSSATVPLAGVVMIQAWLGPEPSWIRALVIGCAWFASLEMGWEAIDRRDGSRRTGAALARRMQEVSSVIVVTLGIGLIAVLGTRSAPSRSVLLQAVVLGLVLASFVMLIRRIGRSSGANQFGQSS